MCGLSRAMWKTGWHFVSAGKSNLYALRFITAVIVNGPLLKPFACRISKFQIKSGEEYFLAFFELNIFSLSSTSFSSTLPGWGMLQTQTHTEHEHNPNERSRNTPCASSGHVLQQETSNNSSSQLLLFKGFINNKVVNVSIDNGANGNLIPNYIVTEQNLLTEPQKLFNLIYGNSNTETCASQTTVHLSIDKFSYTT